MLHVVLVRSLAMCGVGPLCAEVVAVGDMLCMLARTSLGRMLLHVPHFDGVARLLGWYLADGGLVARGVDRVYELLVRDGRRDGDVG
jgi:hypothetical protein